MILKITSPPSESHVRPSGWLALTGLLMLGLHTTTYAQDSNSARQGRDLDVGWAAVADRRAHLGRRSVCVLPPSCAGRSKIPLIFDRHTSVGASLPRLEIDEISNRPTCPANVQAPCRNHRLARLGA